MEHGEAGRRDDQRAAFLQRFGAAYRGGWDPADALAWRADPDRPLPSGAPSPSGRVRELELVVYSTRTADGSDAAEELARLIGELDRQRIEIDRAIAEASASDTPDARTVEGTDAAPAAGEARSPGLRTAVIAVAGAAAGVILALGVLQLAGGSTDSGDTASDDVMRGSVDGEEQQADFARGGPSEVDAAAERLDRQSTEAVLEEPGRHRLGREVGRVLHPIELLVERGTE